VGGGGRSGAGLPSKCVPDRVVQAQVGRGGWHRGSAGGIWMGAAGAVWREDAAFCYGAEGGAMWSAGF
jgi:hypothetical protein